MARWALFFGLILLIMGIFAYAGGDHSTTALMPAYFGIILGVLGATARTEKEKTRMIAMHIAAAVGVIGFLMTVSGIRDYLQMQKGVYMAHPKLVQEHAETSLLLLFFVLLCVLSFIRARRERQAAASGKPVSSH